MLHVRIPDDIQPVLLSLNQQGGKYPQFAGRSAVHVATELIRESPTFKEAKRQMESERHPRPGGIKR